MSRIGKKPVALPSGVKVSFDNGTLSVIGPKGELKRNLIERMTLDIEADQILIRSEDETRTGGAFRGLTRALVANMVEGVSKGFEKVLEINGVGYRAEMKGKVLNLALGYSHGIEFPLPEGITAEVEKQTKIIVRGADKELVGATAAKIRSFREPEPYKGKGIKYAEERIIRKAGKTGKK